MEAIRTNSGTKLSAISTVANALNVANAMRADDVGPGGVFLAGSQVVTALAGLNPDYVPAAAIEEIIDWLGQSAQHGERWVDEIERWWPNA